MVTECNATQMEFEGVGRLPVVVSNDGGHLSSDGGAMLVGELDRRLGVTSRLSECFEDHRDPDLVEHSVLDLVRQRVYGLALGYENLNDHDDLLRDPLLALVLGKRDPLGTNRRRGSDAGTALASSSTLNRFELTPASAPISDGSMTFRSISDSGRNNGKMNHPQKISAEARFSGKALAKPRIDQNQQQRHGYELQSE